MSPRKRQRQNQDLPPNLYKNGKYFLYKNPVTKKSHSLNMGKKEAMAAAIEANAILAQQQATNIANKIVGADDKQQMAALLDQFETDYLPRLNLATRTLKEHGVKLNKYRADFGSKKYGDITLEFWSDYLDQFPANSNAYVKHRGLLIHFYKWAISRGIAGNTSNYPQMTLTGIKQEKSRQPITAAQVEAIVKEAPEWLEQIIRFCRLTLLRRADLVAIKKTDIDKEKRSIKVQISKTKNYSNPVFLEICLTDKAWQIVKDRLSALIPSPYLFSYSPERRSRKSMDSKPHWSAITPQHLTNSFKKARDATGLFDDMPALSRPTLHEVRGLGSRELKESGVDDSVIQALMGHSDFSTTELYLDDGKNVYKELKIKV